jgi:hypothetical protein
MPYLDSLDIANRALQHVGQSQIATVTEDSKQNFETAFTYDKVRRAELRRNVWRFATRRVVLRAIDSNTKIVVPAAYDSTKTYLPGALVVDANSQIWFSMTPDNINNTPGVTDVWDMYFGPLTVSVYDSATTYSAGELVYKAGAVAGSYAVYMSLENDNADAPDVATAYDATVTYRRDQVVSSGGFQWRSLIEMNKNITPAVGPLAYDATATYAAAQTVTGSDNFIYSSVAGSNIGHDPVTDGGVHWTNTNVANAWARTPTIAVSSIKWLVLTATIESLVFPVADRGGPIIAGQHAQRVQVAGGVRARGAAGPEGGVALAYRRAERAHGERLGIRGQLSRHLGEWPDHLPFRRRRDQGRGFRRHVLRGARLPHRHRDLRVADPVGHEDPDHRVVLQIVHGRGPACECDRRRGSRASDRRLHCVPRMTTYTQSSFLGGEWSKTMQARFDRPDYRTAMNVCLNGLMTETGAWTRRIGTRHAGLSRGGVKAKTIPFAFEEDMPYVMEFTAGHLRFWRGLDLVHTNDSQVVTSISGANPALVAVPAVNTWVTGDQVFFTGLDVNTPLLMNRCFIWTKVSTTSGTLTDAITGATINGSTLGTLAATATVNRALDIVTPFTESLCQVCARCRPSFRRCSSPARCRSSHGYTADRHADLCDLHTDAPDFLDGPYLDPPTNGVQITPSALSGNINLALSFGPFDITRSYTAGDYVTFSSQCWQVHQQRNRRQYAVGSARIELDRCRCRHSNRPQRIPADRHRPFHSHARDERLDMGHDYRPHQQHSVQSGRRCQLWRHDRQCRPCGGVRWQHFQVRRHKRDGADHQHPGRRRGHCL